MNMKTALHGSLAANVILLAWLACEPASGKRGRPTESAAADPQSLRRSVPRLAWIDRLREEGIEERLIASLAASDYEDRWQKRLLDLQQQLSRGEIEASDMEDFVAGHEAGLESRMRDCLGEAGLKAWDRERVLRNFDTARLALSAPEADALYRIRKGLDDQRRELQAALLRGEIDETDIERQTEANHDRYERDLKDLLGQTRYASLQPGDGQAGELHRDLARIGAGGEQVEAVLAAQEQWKDARERADDERKRNGSSDEQFEQQLQTLDADRDRRLLETLGSDALAELRMQQDDRYQTLRRSAGAWNLNGGDIARVYSTLRDYDDRVKEYQRNVDTDGNPVEPSVMEDSLRKLARENESGLLDYLGPERFERLRKSGVLAEPP